MKKFVSLLAVLFLLSACSGSGKPSDSEIEKAVTTWMRNSEPWMPNNSERIVVINNFKKTNGYAKDGQYIAYIEFDKQTPREQFHEKFKATMIKTEKGWIIKDFNTF